MGWFRTEISGLEIARGVLYQIVGWFRTEIGELEIARGVLYQMWDSLELRSVD